LDNECPIEVLGDSVKLSPTESIDWNYARTRRVILREKGVEWSSSVFSVPVKWAWMTFTTPNRDVPYEGLLVNFEKSCFKVLEAVGVALKDVKLTPLDIAVSPNSVTYRYNAEDKLLVVTYVVRRIRRTAVLEITLKGVNQPIYILPLYDIRHFYEPPSSVGYMTAVTKNNDGLVLKVSRNGLAVYLYPVNKYLPHPGLLEWTYKLGDLEREDTPQGLIFKSKKGILYCPGICVVKPESIIRISSPEKTAPVKGWKRNGLPAIRSQTLIEKLFSLRIRALSHFGLTVEYKGLKAWFPEAGSWWFREAWFRDALEGVFWNLKTYLKLLRYRDKVKSLLSLTQKILYDLEYLPNKLDGGNESCDAPPLFFLSSARFSIMTGDLDLLRGTLKLAEKLTAKLLRGETAASVKLVNGLIAAAPQHTWIDSVIRLEDALWPARLPLEWATFLSEKEAFRKQFAFPEINALWVSAMSQLEMAAKAHGLAVPDGVKKLREEVFKAFQENFINGTVVYAAIDVDKNLKDGTPSSTALVALSLLSDRISPRKLAEIWRAFLNPLLIYRRTVLVKPGTRMPFAVLVRLPPRPFLGDDEYHRGVAWPRDVPYLVKLLDFLGDHHATTEILVNHLDHMVSEAAVLYENELFSSSLGENPSPEPGYAENPVPVKNPAQYWSHWCDPFLEYLF